MTSHAAVVARGWGKPCVAGCSDIVVNYKRKSFTNGEVTVKEGDSTVAGESVLGKIKTSQATDNSISESQSQTSVSGP
ncbi:MAG: PEP-utilizing enzyme [Balneolaceae bacterium]|nr:PEP-utilizing enzyme [Balneolaceae bacterium]